MLSCFFFSGLTNTQGCSKARVQGHFLGPFLGLYSGTCKFVSCMLFTSTLWFVVCRVVLKQVILTNSGPKANKTRYILSFVFFIRSLVSLVQ